MPANTQAALFNPQTFLGQTGDGRTTLQCQKNRILFAQGDTANAAFYIQEGQVKLSVVSQHGKEAVVAILKRGDFFGEECFAGQLIRRTTATSLEKSSIVRIDKSAMMNALHNDPAFSQLFLTSLLSRSIRIQDDLVDQLFNCAEKRLARTLLLLDTFEGKGTPERVTTEITHEMLAEMVGTTRSRVSFFMNRFKKLGFVEYADGLQVHRARLSSVLAS